MKKKKKKKKNKTHPPKKKSSGAKRLAPSIACVTPTSTRPSAVTHKQPSLSTSPASPSHMYSGTSSKGTAGPRADRQKKSAPALPSRALSS